MHLGKIQTDHESTLLLNCGK